MAEPGDGLERAFSMALDLHRGQKRKGTDIPYLSHLMAVSAIIMENGGDERQAIAGLSSRHAPDLPCAIPKPSGIEFQRDRHSPYVKH